MRDPYKPLKMLAVGVILLMAAALAADVAVNSTNIDLTGYAEIVGAPLGSHNSVLDVQMTGYWPSARAGGFYAPTTGTAVFGNAAGGVGVYGDSENTYGVRGSSDNSWGGYFSSSGGYGIRVDTSGIHHYDHGAYITSNWGYAVYAQSAQNMGVRGEAGDVTGISQPLGPVGVVGIGSGRGVYGSSGNSSGVYGISNANYGIWGQSTTYRGVTGRTESGDNNYGLYTPDNMYSLNYNKLGSMMQVVYNDSATELEIGDVVVFKGILKPEERRFTKEGDPAPSAFNDEPVVKVARAVGDSPGLLAGVVFSRFDLDALDDSDLIEYDVEGVDDPLKRFREAYPDGKAPDVTPAGAVAPGEFLLVVTQGPALVRASGSEQAIKSGDRLGVGLDPGRAVHLNAGRAVMAAKTSAEPMLLGAALEPLTAGEELIYVFVSPR